MAASGTRTRQMQAMPVRLQKRLNSDIVWNIVSCAHGANAKAMASQAAERRMCYVE